MVDRGRRKVILGTGALLAGAGCMSNNEKDSDGDGVPDKYDYAPHDPNVQAKSDIQGTTTTDQYTETTQEPTTQETTTYEDTATTTSAPDGEVSMAYLEQHSPEIAKGMKHWNSTGRDGYNWEIVRGENRMMQMYRGYDEDVMAIKKDPLTIYFDEHSDKDVSGQRYRIEAEMSTDRFGPYADLSKLKEQGKFDSGEQLREDVAYLLGYMMFAELNKKYGQFANVVETQQKDYQDAISVIDHTIHGAKGGKITLTLDNKTGNNLDYVSNQSHEGNGRWPISHLIELGDNLMEVHS